MIRDARSEACAESRRGSQEGVVLDSGEKWIVRKRFIRDALELNAEGLLGGRNLMLGVAFDFRVDCEVKHNI